MSATNKLIESIAEHFVDAMTDIVRHASEYGDTATVEAVANVLRDDGYVVVPSDNLAAALSVSVDLADLIEAARLSAVAMEMQGSLYVIRNAVLDDIERLRNAVGEANTK